MNTKIDIISGFLGSGKTTLIKKLLDGKLYKEKLVIIENEFGEIGIDGGILKNSNIEVKEINSGCICCTVVGDFEKSLEEVISKYKPERILIEPSGVGKLSDVIKACNSPKLKEMLTINILATVVDVLKYKVYMNNFGEFFEDQIINAKTIILSRTQKVDIEKLESIVMSITKLNDKANIVTTPWENIEADQIISLAEKDITFTLEHQLMKDNGESLKNHIHTKDCKCGHKHKHSDNNSNKHRNEQSHNHRADEVFDVWGIETPRSFTQDELNEILTVLCKEETYGLILRGKGILQINKEKWLQFDYVPGEFDFKNTKADYTGRVCIIGKDLNKRELSKLFHI